MPTDPDTDDDLAWGELPEACRLALLDLARRDLGIARRPLTVRQIAEASGVPRSTVHASEVRALLRLRARLDRDL